MMTDSHPRPSWLDTARFYEVYPQSFADANGDGIGDIPGLIGRLDYIDSVGCNAIWLNPCFDSPFKDAGYDVRDYTKVAPRYGTNDDLVALFRTAHERGMHVILDLVPGHTSEEHAWFRTSCAAEPADRTVETADGGREDVSERYIWTDCWISGADGLPFIGGEAERDGTYVLNFFKCQPALNFGFAHPRHAWQKPALGKEALATCEALLEVMRFWLSRGADGFRVDMADSLVKQDDEGKPYTIRTWQWMFDRIRPEFPEAVFVSEWGRPHESMAAGFDMDFYLDWRWDGVPNGYNMLLRNTDTPLTHDNDASYFNADSGASIAPFLRQWEPQYADVERAGGCFNFITCNHDTLRTAQRLTDRERKLAYATLLTLPGVPFLYYGDEIGMRYRPLPTREGGYVRTGSRTPMQWDTTANLGFSPADAADLYLPVDPAPDAPTVASQEADADSLLNWIRRVMAVRASSAALQARAGYRTIAAPEHGRLFAFLREAPGGGESSTAGPAAATVGGNDVTTDGAGRVLVAVNPGHAVESFALPEDVQTPYPLTALGGHRVTDGTVTLEPQSLVILRV